MTNNYLSIAEASLRSGFSQLQIWILIRKRLLPVVEIDDWIMVDFILLRRWMLENSSLSMNFCAKVDERNSRYSISKRIDLLTTQARRRERLSLI